MNWKMLIAGCLGAGLLCAQSEASKRLDAAADAFKEVMDTPDKSIPQDLLNKAQCVIIVPGLKKGAFIVGAKYGRGFVVVPEERRCGLVRAGLHSRRGR